MSLANFRRQDNEERRRTPFVVGHIPPRRIEDTEVECGNCGHTGQLSNVRWWRELDRWVGECNGELMGDVRSSKDREPCRNTLSIPPRVPDDGES